MNEMKLLERPGYGRLWAAARRRLESNGLSLEGTPLTLRGLTRDESDAIAGLLGARRPPSGAPLRVSLDALDQCLRASSIRRGLLDVLAALGGPLVDRRAEKAAREATWAREWEALATHRAVRGDGRMCEWLEHVRRTGLARRLAGDSRVTAMREALDVVDALRLEARYRLAVLAAEALGDAHALDRGRPVGTLAVHALAWRRGESFPADAADWRRVWAEAGVACDDLSCGVLVLNLPGCSAEPLRLTLRQVMAWSAPASARGPAYVCENPAVLAAAADEIADLSPPLICVEGMPSTAALIVLESLAAVGSDLRYHGDFDWRGLTIAGVVARKLPMVAPWRYEAVDYCRAVAAGVGTVDLAGQSSTSPWDPELAPAMEDAGVAIYEEQVLADLLDDLRR